MYCCRSDSLTEGALRLELTSAGVFLSTFKFQIKTAK